MPTIQRTSPTFGAVKSNLDGIPPRASASELKQLVANNWGAVTRGSVPLLTKSEAAFVDLVANPDWWADFGDSVTERYPAWMGQ